ncbi:MAG: DUF4342 domain-containing protein [Chloroflexi bacterium]|nr:MAG: DUF4342 domain-containing protein [Chloroflexota bacterium]
MTNEKVNKEEFVVSGEAVIGTIKDLLHQGNIRRISIKTEEGKELIEIPLTIGVVGAILLPVWAAIGAIAALAAKLRIVVEKVEPVTKGTNVSPQGGDPGQSGEEPPVVDL